MRLGWVVGQNFPIRFTSPRPSSKNEPGVLNTTHVPFAVP